MRIKCKLNADMSVKPVLCCQVEEHTSCLCNCPISPGDCPTQVLGCGDVVVVLIILMLLGKAHLKNTDIWAAVPSSGLPPSPPPPPLLELRPKYGCFLNEPSLITFSICLPSLWVGGTKKPKNLELWRKFGNPTPQLGVVEYDLFSL